MNSNSWVEELSQFGHDMTGTSQFGEHNVIDFIFQHINPVNKFFVDIGAGHYSDILGSIVSNTNHLLSQEWEGIMFDMNNEVDPRIKKHFVTPYNIEGLLDQYRVPFTPALLSIDIDSFDLDVLEAAMCRVSPDVICTEFNATLEPHISVKLKYESGYTWDGTNKYGYSFAAGVKFAQVHKYTIILNHLDMNLFMVRSNILDAEPGLLPGISSKQQNYHPWNEKAIWENY